MPSNWYRTGNFFEYYKDRGDVVNMVAYKNCAPIVSIKEISICRYKDKEVRIFIKPSQLFEDKVKDVVLKFFPNNSQSNKVLSMQIYLSFLPGSLATSISIFTQMLSYLNKSFEKIEFPEELFKELFVILTVAADSKKVFNDKNSHIIQEFTQVYKTHPNPLKQKSTTIIDIFQYASKDYLVKNLKAIRKFIRHLVNYGEDPNQINEAGDSPLKCAIMYMEPEDTAFFLWHGADPRFRPIQALFSNNAFEISKEWNKLDHFNMLVFSSPKKALTLPRLQVEHIDVLDGKSQIITNVLLTNNRSVSTHFMTSEELYKAESEKTKAELFRLFSIFFFDPKGDSKKTKENFEAEFSAEANKVIDLIFDNVEKRLIGFILIRVINDQDSIVVKFEYMALATDSILRYCGGIWLFAARWGCLVKNLYPSNIVKAYYLASDYNSFRAMQDGLATPKKQSKWMLESNQRMLNLEFNRPVRIYYDRFVALQGLLKVTDKKDPNRSIEFGEYCYKQFILKYDIDQDKKKLQEELGYEPVQASVVSSIIGKRYVNSFAQDLKMALNVNLIEHVQNLSLKMFPKIKSFLPLLNQYKSNPKGSLLDLEDESLLFYTGVTYRSKL